MKNTDKLLTYLEEQNGKATYSDIRNKFVWKSNYLSEIVKKLGNQVKKDRISYSGKDSMGGKRFDKILIVNNIRPSTPTPKIVTTEVQYVKQSLPLKQIKEKINVPIKINGSIPKITNLDKDQLSEKLFENIKQTILKERIKGFNLTQKKYNPKPVMKTIYLVLESLTNLQNYKPKVLNE